MFSFLISWIINNADDGLIWMSFLVPVWVFNDHQTIVMWLIRGN